MLTAIGPGVASLKDYTEYIAIDTQDITLVQGNTQGQYKAAVWDWASQFTITDEDDIVACDESDINGWPGVNLLGNSSFEAPYTSGLAADWSSSFSGGATGITLAQNTASPLFGASCQSLALSNAAANETIQVYQQIQLPQDEYGAVIRDFPHYFSVYLKISSAFSGLSSASIVLAWYDVANVLISTASTPFATNSTTGWVRFSVSANLPSNAYYLRASVQIVTNGTGTNSGTLLMDGAQVERAIFGGVFVSANQTALQAGYYPTAYIDANQPGCHVEQDLSGLAYRQKRLFGGIVRIAEAHYVGPARLIDITAVDFSVLLSEAPATLVIDQQSDYNAIQQAVTYAKNQGFLVGLDTTTYVQTIGTIDAHAYSWQTTADVLAQVSNQTVAAYWVDNYCFLHYAPALAVSAPYALSDNPDFASSYPFFEFYYTLDATSSRTSPVIEGSTQLSNPITQQLSGDGTTTVFTFNGGQPIVQVDAVSVGGVQQTVGLTSVNDFSQGYTALIYPPNAQITFQTAPASGTNNIAITYRFAAPVLIRVQLPTMSRTTQGHLNRKISAHQKIANITSKQAAIDRANADLSQYKKARPVAYCVVICPPAPIGAQLLPGTAVAITHAPSQFSGQLFQIQQIDIYPLGNGVYRYELQLGFYRPDFAIQDANATHEQAASTDQLSGGVLDDIVTVLDSWQMADEPIIPTVDNQTVWGPTTSTTWNGANVYG